MQKAADCLERGRTLHCIWSCQKKESHMWVSDVKAAGRTILRSSFTPCSLMSAAVSSLSPMGCLVPDQHCANYMWRGLCHPDTSCWGLMLHAVNQGCENEGRSWKWQWHLQLEVFFFCSCSSHLPGWHMSHTHTKKSLGGAHVWMDPQGKLLTLVMQPNE